jgi:hypothetical protein
MARRTGSESAMESKLGGLSSGLLLVASLMMEWIRG